MEIFLYGMVVGISLVAPAAVFLFFYILNQLRGLREEVAGIRIVITRTVDMLKTQGVQNPMPRKRTMFD